MSRVEKELASLAPWAWDPLVGKHAPGSALGAPPEVVADKTVTGNTDSYRIQPGRAAPHGADGTPAHAHVGHQRARSPRRVVFCRRPSRRRRGAEGLLRILRRPCEPSTRRRQPPPLAASKQHTATKPSASPSRVSPRTDPRPRSASAGVTAMPRRPPARRVGKNLARVARRRDSRRRRRRTRRRGRRRRRRRRRRFEGRWTRRRSVF